jgi:ABC-2 type transport system ATP-binding protein
MTTYAIETHGLTRRFGERAAVDDLSITIPTGAVFGFLGPNGAGKTTTVRMLAALIAPSSGTARVAGRALGAENAAIRRAVGMLTEAPGLYEKLSAWQNLRFFAGLYGVDERQLAPRAERYMRALGLWERRDDAVGGFSKGMRQKVALIRALVHAPQVIFLDEPTSGLDPEAARTVRNFVRELRAEGRTIFLTTHNLAEADELCDQVAVFRTRLLQVGTPASLRATLFGRGTRVLLAGDAAPLLAAVRALPFVSEASAEGGALDVTLASPDDDNPALVRALVEAGAAVRYVQPRQHSLEEVYLELVEQA